MKTIYKLISIIAFTILYSCKNQDPITETNSYPFTYETRKIDFVRLDSSHLGPLRHEETLTENGVKLDKIQLNLTTTNLSKKDSSVFYSGTGSIIDICIIFNPKESISKQHIVVSDDKLKGIHGAIEVDVDTKLIQDTEGNSVTKRDPFVSGNLSYMEYVDGIKISLDVKCKSGKTVKGTYFGKPIN
jgi:hypothetical protein